MPTGRKVAAAAAGHLKHVTMELGGKSPLIVFDDADIESAVGGAMLGNFYSSGQVCSNGTRVFVQKKAKARFLDNLKSRTEAMILGDPSITPPISARWSPRPSRRRFSVISKGQGGRCDAHHRRRHPQQCRG